MLKTTIAIGSRSETFVLIQTNAPKAYDCGGAIELYDGTHGTVVERYVLIPEDQLDWQRGRNGSGLHSVVTDNLLLDETDIARTLWRRMLVEAP